MNAIPAIIYPGKLKTLLVAAFFLSLLCSMSAAFAYEVIIIKDTEIKPYRDAIEGFKSACGCNVKELEIADDNVLEKVISERPDAVFAVGTRAFRKARVLRNSPVIYAMVMPAELADVSADNISGVSMNIAPETYLAAMIDLFPGVKRIGVVSDPKHTGSFVEEAAAVARAKGLALVVKNIHDARQAPALLDGLRGKVDAVWMLPDATFINPETVNYLMLFSFQNKAPVFSFSRKYVEMGATAALSIDPFELGAQAGKILRRLSSRGKKGAIQEYARSPRIIVNMKVAAKLGVKIRDESIKNAERVE